MFQFIHLMLHSALVSFSYTFIGVYHDHLEDFLIFLLVFKKKTHLLTAPPLSSFSVFFSNSPVTRKKSFTRGEVCLCQRGLGHAFDHDTLCCGGGQKRNEPNITFWFKLLQENLGINLCNDEIINRCFYD